jgi:hypothetical protein
MSFISNKFRRINWYSFWIQRQKVYDVLNRTVTISMWCVIGYIAVNGALMWSEGMNRMWLQYVKKERERQQLMEIIREAREEEKLPASKQADFQ